MIRSTASKVMWVGRATVFLVGLSVILALVFGVATSAMGANGKPFLLGKRNVASAISTLVKQGPGPALNLVVGAGQPPLAVNSTARVANLNAATAGRADSAAQADSATNAQNAANAQNADQLDNVDSSEFLNGLGRTAMSRTLLEPGLNNTEGTKPVARVTIDVPGSKPQFVKIHGEVSVFGNSSACPCYINTSIKDVTGNTSTPVGYYTHPGGSQYQQVVGRSWVFAASPGTRTYELQVAVYQTSTDLGLLNPSLIATSHPLGSTGSTTLSVQRATESGAQPTQDGRPQE